MTTINLGTLSDLLGPSAPTARDFDVRKAALDAAVMSHGPESEDAEVIETALKFEAYLRNGVTKLTAAMEDGAEPDACDCSICQVSAAIKEALADQVKSKPEAPVDEPAKSPAETPAS